MIEIKTNGLLTIIIPCYNGERYLNRCISSLNELNEDISILFINDGSTDSSKEIISEYIESKPNAYLINKINGGYSSAINCGLDHCGTEYVMFLGVDDEIIANGINSICYNLQAHNPDILAFTTIKVYDDNKSVGRETDDLTQYHREGYYEKDIINLYSNLKNDVWILFTRDTSRCFKMSKINNLRYFGKIGVAADGCFSSLVACSSNSFEFVNKDCYIWHLHSDSVSASRKNTERLLDEANVWCKYFKYLGEKYQLTKIPRPILTHLYAYKNVVNALAETGNAEIQKEHEKEIKHIMKWLVNNKMLSLKSLLKLYYIKLFV